MSAMTAYWDGVGTILGLNPTQVAALKALAPPWSDLQYSNPALAEDFALANAALGEVTDGLGATVVKGPNATTPNKLPQWDTTARVMKDGRAIGVASSSDVIDRAAGDGRYAMVGGSPAFAAASLDQPGGQFRLFAYRSSGQNRFLLGVDNVVDAGGSTGSNFHLYRSLDDGSNIDVLRVVRSNGEVYASGPWTFYGSINAGINTINAGVLSLQRSGYPILDFRDQSAALDQKLWRMYAAPDGGFALTTVDDATTTSFAAFSITRSGTAPQLMAINANLVPAADNQKTLGNPSNRWSTVYAATSPINTSDATEKTLVDDGLLDADGLLTPLGLRIVARVKLLAYKWNAAIVEKGLAGARIHHGMLSQAWQAAFDDEGCDPADFALWCADPMLAEVVTSVTRQREKSELVDGPEVVEVVDGQARLVPGPQVRQPVVELLPVFRDGAPVMLPPVMGIQPVEGGDLGEVEEVELLPARPMLQPVPVLEDYEDLMRTLEPTGDVRYSLRYDLAMILLHAEARTEIAALKARVAALEAA